MRIPFGAEFQCKANLEMFIEVTSVFGAKYKITLNTRYIREICPATDGGTTIALQGQTSITVLEDYDELRARLGALMTFYDKEPPPEPKIGTDPK